MIDPARELAPLDALETLLSELPSAVERSDLGGALDLAADAITKHSSSLEQLKQLGEAAPSIRPTLEPTDLALWTSALGGLSDLGTLMSKASTVDELNTIRHKVNAIDTTIQTLKAGALRAWSTKLARELLPTIKLADALKGIPETRAIGLRIDSLKTKVSALEYLLPVKGVIDSYHKYLEEAGRIRSELSDIGGEEVVVFLRAVAEDNATVDILTEKVLTWIRSKGLSKRFKVKLT